jgi:hypothetical protein
MQSAKTGILSTLDFLFQFGVQRLALIMPGLEPASKK